MADKKEYIERGALLKTPPFTKYGGDSSAYVEGYLDCAEEARKAVNDAPAAEVVEVVRCAKCRYVRLIVDIIGNPNLYCGKRRDYPNVDFDDFCSWGKRKEKDDGR